MLCAYIRSIHTVCRYIRVSVCVLYTWSLDRQPAASTERYLRRGTVYSPCCVPEVTCGFVPSPPSIPLPFLRPAPTPNQKEKGRREREQARASFLSCPVPPTCLPTSAPILISCHHIPPLPAQRTHARSLCLSHASAPDRTAPDDRFSPPVDPSRLPRATSPRR